MEFWNKSKLTADWLNECNELNTANQAAEGGRKRQSNNQKTKILKTRKL